MIVLDLSILNQKGTPMFNSDLTANRPAAGIVGRIFIATDSPYGIFRDTGTAWDSIAGASTFSGSLATGQVAFGSATNTISGTNNLFWNNANANLGIGSNAVNSVWKLGVDGPVVLNGALTFGSVASTTSNAFIEVSATQMRILAGASRYISFSANLNEFARLQTTGNFILGGTLADNGNRLQVAGNITVTENITARRTITSNGDSTDFGGFFYSNPFGVTTATIFSLNTSVFGGIINSNYASINDSNGLGLLSSATANYLQISSSRNPGVGQIGATGIINFVNLTTIGSSFLSGSSSVTYNAINVNYTINRSGTGIMRGFYYNPTITSLGGSVHNAIQTTSGNVLFGSNFFWDNTNGSLGIGTNSIYTPTTFNLDVNGGLLVKNTAGRTAQITLINADPSIGGNNGFLVASVGGTSGGSYVDFQGYYGTSITGSTALRLNPAGGAVIVNSTTNTGEQFQLTGTLRINGQQSATSGGNSGQHLIINLDGTTYKIKLELP
jgi:hypothetical protein